MQSTIWIVFAQQSTGSLNRVYKAIATLYVDINSLEVYWQYVYRLTIRYRLRHRTTRRSTTDTCT